jgi:hypothetical protein
VKLNKRHFGLRRSDYDLLLARASGEETINGNSAA